MRKILEKYLRFLAKRILEKYNPKIIGITGSVGKTSTKEAVNLVLQDDFKVRKNIKNYNNEIGIPLTIIGHESGGRNLFKWLSVSWQSLKLILTKQDYPEILILEMGIDHPGDMKYLTEFIKPDISIVTAIGKNIPVHVEFFKGIDHLIREKRVLAEATKETGKVFLNRDDISVYNMSKNIKAPYWTYGFHAQSDLLASDVKIITKFANDKEAQEVGLNCKLNFQGSVVPLYLPNVLGKHQIYSVLAATCVGLELGLNLVNISKGLEGYVSPKGRMNVISGIKHTMLIDDTYNASPPAVIAALEVLKNIESVGKKWAILGNMAELGQYTTRGHNVVGETVLENKIDYLVTVGDLAKIIASKANELGMDYDCIFEFAEVQEAGKFVQEKMKQGDVLLVKGSQSVRMEKIVKEIMAEPLRAEDLLVRQETKWLKS